MEIIYTIATLSVLSYLAWLIGELRYLSIAARVKHFALQAIGRKKLALWQIEQGIHDLTNGELRPSICELERALRSLEEEKWLRRVSGTSEDLRCWGFDGTEIVPPPRKTYWTRY